MKKFKALNILDDKGFWPEKAAVADAVREVLALGQCREPLPVRDYGRYRDPQWRDDKNKLVPWRSVDWYVYHALDEERLQVDSSQILEDLCSEPWRDDRLMGDHYDLLLIEEDMFDPPEDAQDRDEAAYSVGRCRRFAAAVVSTHRIDHIWGIPYSFVKTEVMRQICFMFGIPAGWREDVEKGRNGTVFCANTCILRPATVAPGDWGALTSDRVKHGALCESCTRDLRHFFLMAGHEAN